MFGIIVNEYLVLYVVFSRLSYAPRTISELSSTVQTFDTSIRKST
jgi:hypothetical protein